MKCPNGLPVYYYPTTAVFVDDSERFLTTISLKLDTKLAYVSFTDPVQALEYIAKNSTSDDLINKCLSENTKTHDFGLLSSEYDVKINLNNLYQQIYNPQRFNEATVVVVDYSMPRIDGVEFCERLRKMKNPIKIILLTGEADESTVIEMFNAGFIDKFVLKGSLNFAESVSDAIVELQKSFFEAQSDIIIRNLSAKSISCLKDQAFINTFKEICLKNNIAEYYLIQNTGSFFLLTFNGTPLWLIVCTDDEFAEYTDVAQDAEASQAVLTLLKTRQKIPYFKDLDEYVNATGMQWEAYLHSAKIIQGSNKNYYYAMVKDENLPEIRRADLISYQYYLENIWPPI